jgi:hypothetical protein
LKWNTGFSTFYVCENFLVQKNIHCTPTKLKVAQYKGRAKWHLLFSSQNGESVEVKVFFCCVEEYFWFPFGKSLKALIIIRPSDSHSGFSNAVEM